MVGQLQRPVSLACSTPDRRTHYNVLLDSSKMVIRKTYRTVTHTAGIACLPKSGDDALERTRSHVELALSSSTVLHGACLTTCTTHVHPPHEYSTAATSRGTTLGVTGELTHTCRSAREKGFRATSLLQ